MSDKKPLVHYEGSIKELAAGDVLDIASGGVSQSAMTTYTPSLTNLTLGTGGTIVGRYLMLSKKVCFVEIMIVLGSSGFSVGNAAYFDLPFNKRDTTGNQGFGSGTLRDVSSGQNHACMFLYYGSSNKNVFIGVPTVSGTTIQILGTSSSTPFTWAAGDIIFLSGTYEIG
jgi:hypothetical protein